jgi:hypothetical protein
MDVRIMVCVTSPGDAPASKPARWRTCSPLCCHQFAILLNVDRAPSRRTLIQTQALIKHITPCVRIKKFPIAKSGNMSYPKLITKMDAPSDGGDDEAPVSHESANDRRLRRCPLPFHAGWGSGGAIQRTATGGN